jgi:hypothetical protein
LTSEGNEADSVAAGVLMSPRQVALARQFLQQ